MDFFGIGWLELFFIVIIILLVAGPKDIQKGAKGLGRLINRLNNSPNYQAIRRASAELRNLPQRLAREANLEELKELTQEVAQVKQEVQQVRQEIKENTHNIAGASTDFKAWVQEVPAGEAAPKPDVKPPLPPIKPAPAPANNQAQASPPPAANGPKPAPDPAASQDA